jgi:hypothetical protein
MIRFSQPLPDEPQHQWRYQIDRFVAENQSHLAALWWGLRQEWGEDSQDFLGIDIKPTPHFIRCSRESLETLNQQLEQKIQEILGILDGYNPEAEIVMIGLGEGQIKLIYFQPQLTPATCFAQLTSDLDALISQLEELMGKYISV